MLLMKREFDPLSRLFLDLEDLGDTAKRKGGCIIWDSHFLNAGKNYTNYDKHPLFNEKKAYTIRYDRSLDNGVISHQNIVLFILIP